MRATSSTSATASSRCCTCPATPSAASASSTPITAPSSPATSPSTTAPYYYDFLPESNVADYIETMHKLLDLPVRTVHGGHDGSFGRVRLLEIAHQYINTRAAKAV